MTVYIGLSAGCSADRPQKVISSETVESSEIILPEPEINSTGETMNDTLSFTDDNNLLLPFESSFESLKK